MRTTIAKVLDALNLPVGLPLGQPADLAVDQRNRLIVTVDDSGGAPEITKATIGATGKVSLKAAPGVVFRASFAPGEAFGGQLYFMLFDKAEALVVAGDVPDLVVPFRLADKPIAIIDVQPQGASFLDEITAAVSVDPHEFDITGGIPDGSVSALLI